MEEEKKVVEQPYIAMYMYGERNQPARLVLCRFDSLMHIKGGCDEILGTQEHDRALATFVGGDRYVFLANVNVALSAFYRTQEAGTVTDRAMLAFFRAYVDELGKQKG